MKSDKTTPAAGLTADANRSEILFPIGGQPHVVRFGLKFLKAFTSQVGGTGVVDALTVLETAPVQGLLDMLTLGIQLSVPADQLPEGFDADAATDLIDALPVAEQQQIFTVLINSINRNPILAALSSQAQAAN